MSGCLTKLLILNYYEALSAGAWQGLEELMWLGITEAWPNTDLLQLILIE